MRVGLMVASPAEVLHALWSGGIWTRRLYADYVIARLPLSDAEWEAVPSPCGGLGRALPAALDHSAGQAEQLLSRMLLPRAEKARLRTLALCLAREQRRLRVILPSLAVQRVLALCLLNS